MASRAPARPNLETPRPEQFISITDMSRLTGFDPKSIKKYAVTRGLPLVELSPGKKGCFYGALRAWMDGQSGRGGIC